jgi:hypothetical protein
MHFLPRPLVGTITALILGSVLALAQATARTGVRVLDTPAAAGSGMYALAPAPEAGNGAVLSWLETLPGGEHALRYATWEGEAWSPAMEVARGRQWFANWADHPSVVPLPDRALLAHWLVRSGDGTRKYAYGVQIARSSGPGRAWRPVFAAAPPGDDYAGFVSFLRLSNGVGAAYLMPAAEAQQPSSGQGSHESHAGAEPIKTLVWTTFSLAGDVQSTARLDADVCSCCSTSVARTRRGPLVAYRDRTAGEVRDIAVVRQVDGQWTPPRVVHADGWVIPGCPTNGPAVAADGDRVAIAWFTAAGGTARVNVAFSGDAGETFSAPVPADGGTPIGWTGIVMAGDGGAIVSWLEGVAGGGAQVRLRHVTATGAAGPPVVAASVKGGRTTGIPQLARAGASLLVAWRDDRVRSAVVPLTAVAPPGTAVR